MNELKQEPADLPSEIKVLLIDLVLEGIVTWERKYDGSAFRLTDAGEQFLENWILDNDVASD